MGRNRVAVLVNGSVLTSGVLCLLREHPTVELLPVPQNGEAVYERLRALAPGVIIVDVASAGGEPSMTIGRLLHECPEARVISLGVDRAEIEVYDSRRVACASVADLLTAVEGRGFGGVP